MDQHIDIIKNLERSKSEFLKELYMAQPILQRTSSYPGTTYDVQCRANNLLNDMKTLCDHRFHAKKYDGFMYCKCGERIRHYSQRPLMPEPAT